MKNNIAKVKKWVYVNETFTKPLKQIHKEFIHIKTKEEYDLFCLRIDSIAQDANKLIKLLESKFKKFGLKDYMKDNKPDVDIYESLKIKITVDSRGPSFEIGSFVTYFNYVIGELNKYIHIYYLLD